MGIPRYPSLYTWVGGCVHCYEPLLVSGQGDGHQAWLLTGGTGEPLELVPASFTLPPTLLLLPYRMSRRCGGTPVVKS